jgi:two-component system LytT family response regulator
MKFGLICSENIKTVLTGILRNRKIILDDRADYWIVESGFAPPPGRIAILFQGDNLNPLIELVSRFAMPAENSFKWIIGRTGEDRMEILQYQKICLFEARDDNVFCVTINGEYLVKDKLCELEPKLPPDSFIRVSRSSIVNIANVKEIIPWFGRRLLLRFERIGAEVEVSKNYVKNFRGFLGF